MASGSAEPVGTSRRGDQIAAYMASRAGCLLVTSLVTSPIQGL